MTTPGLPVAVLVAAGLDAVVGEPPTRLHPVAWLGRVVAGVDRAWSRPRLVGVVVAVTMPTTVAGVAATVVLLGASVSASVGTIVSAPVGATVSLLVATLLAGLALFTASSLTMLLDAGDEVIAASATDLPAAREALLALAGRDASRLSAGEVRSAAVESLAENLADGLVAPLCGFLGGALVGGSLGAPTLTLAGAAAGAWWVKTVNTLDSMLGYRSKPVGWAPARLDDATMWVPARLTAALLAIAALAPDAVLRARRWADVPDSPNSGWPMATLAVLLGVRLAKPDHYDLGAGETLPSVADAERGRRIVRRAGLLAVALTAVGAAALWSLSGEVTPWS